MQKKLLHLTAYFFYCMIAVAQSPAADSLWFAHYFSRMKTLRDARDPTAYDSLQIIRALAQEKKLPYFIVQYYIAKSGYFMVHNQPDSAIYYLQNGIQLSAQYKLTEQEGKAHLDLANLYQFNGNTLIAANHYISAAKLLKKSGKIRTLISLYRNLHTVLGRLQQKNSTLQNTYDAIATNKSSVNDLIKIINTQNSEESGFQFADQSLIRESGTDAIYVIFGNAKFAISAGLNFGIYGSSRDVQLVPPGTLAKIADFPRNGSIMRELDDGFIYLARDGRIHPITDFKVLELFGGWDGVYFVPSASLKKFHVSQQTVTMANVNSIFNFGQTFDILSDSIASALIKNKTLSAQLSHIVSTTNTVMQKRKTWLWVFSVGIAALLCILVLLIRNSGQKQKLAAQALLAVKREEELQRIRAIEKERTRIATDMHDDLGAGLSRIKFLSETIGIKKGKKQSFDADVIRIRDYSHEMINKMGEIVWALNEKNDLLSDLLSFTRVYAIEYLTENEIVCEVKLPSEIQERFLSGEFRRNIFLSVKELLHNIVKHAQAKKVWIEFSINEKMHIRIQDDGCGFDLSAIGRFRNGLNNIKNRMTKMNGEFDIKSGAGTQVYLSIPLLQ